MLNSMSLTLQLVVQHLLTVLTFKLHLKCEVQQDPQEQLERLVHREQPEQREQPVRQVQLAQQEVLVLPQPLQDLQELLVQQVQLEHKVPKEFKAQRVQLAQLVLREQLVRQVQRAILVLLETLVLLVGLDQLDTQALLVTPVIQETQARKEFREQLVLLARLETRVLKVPLAQLVTQDLLVTREPRVQLVLLLL
jgi:hypothetical protein